MKKRAAIKYLLSVGMAGLLVGMCTTANASAFQLFEYNGVNAGDFGAGAAAIADDASTAYANPAGMVMIPNQQIVLSENAIITDIQFKGTETWRSTDPMVPSGYSSTQSGVAQGGGTKFVPAFHYVTPLSDRWAFGFSVLSPYGLVTNYGTDSVLRYSGTDTELKTIDLSPSIAFKATDKFSVGAGIDAEHLDATFNGVVGAPPSAPAGSPGALDTRSLNDGSAWGYGWHAGLLYQFTPSTRVGLAYHSQIRFDVNGTSKLEGPLVNELQGGVIKRHDLHTNITLPPFTELSAYHDFNQQWSVDGSLIYTQWSDFNDVLHIQNVQGVQTVQTPTGSILTYQPVTVSVPMHFRNTWRVAVGANYHPTAKWILRAGAGYDESPVENTYRGVRLPDANRYAVALGAHYQAIKTVGIDVGWTHLFIQNTRVNFNAVSGAQVANSTGTYSNHADIIGAQLTWDIT